MKEKLNLTGQKGIIQFYILIFIFGPCKFSFYIFIHSLFIFRLAKRIGVSLYEVSAKTGINCDEAFMDLASAMRDRLLVSNMHSDSDESDHFASAFHVDGVIADEKLINGRSSVSNNCC